jgi:hypothetical protein
MTLITSRVICFGFAFLILTSFPAFARRKLGAEISSNFGVFNTSTTGELSSGTSTINGVSVTTRTFCPPSEGPIDSSVNPPVCPQDYLFLYEIASGPKNMVLTFSGLAGFTFNALASPTFGVLYCELIANLPSGTVNPPCTNMTRDEVDQLNLSFDAIDGNLIVTIPALPTAATFTFFIKESFQNLGNELHQPSALPLLSIGGAIVSPPNVLFGSQEAGTTSDPQTITVINSPDVNDPNSSPTLNLSSITTSAGFSTSGDCAASGTIASGATCAFTTAFSPPTSGNSSSPTTGTFTIADNSPPAKEIASLTGTTSAAGIAIEPSVLFFGSQIVASQSATQAVKITNSTTNSFALNLSIPTNPYSGGADFTNEAGTCGLSLAAGANCQVNIAFTPSFPGSVSATMQISDKAHVVVLNGTGNDSNTATISSAFLSFSGENVGSTSSAQTVTITNAQSSASLNIVAESTTAEFAISNDTCTNASLAVHGQANDSCTISVKFNPTLAGQLTGTLTVANDAQNGSGTLVVPLTGTGMNFGLTAAATTMSVTDGGTATFNLSLVPQGGYSGAVQIACTGAPSESTCTPSPASPSLDGKNAIAVSVAVKTTAPSTVPPLWRGRPPSGWPLLLVTLLCCALLFLVFEFVKRNKRGYVWVPLGALATVLFLCVSCGGGTQSVQTQHDPGTPKGAATLTVTATGGNLQPVTVKLTLNVM